MDLIEVLKAKTQGMPDDVVITITTQQGRSLLSQLKAERQQREAAEAELAALRGEQEHVAWLNDAYLARGVVDGETGSEDAGPGYLPVYR